MRAYLAAAVNLSTCHRTETMRPGSKDGQRLIYVRMRVQWWRADSLDQREDASI